MSRWFEDDFDIRKAPIPPLEDHDLHPTAPTAFGMDGGVYTPLCRCPVDSRFTILTPTRTLIVQIVDLYMCLSIQFNALVIVVDVKDLYDLTSMQLSGGH